MKKKSVIKSSTITDAACYLCQKAACCLPEDVYEGIEDLYRRETSETAKGFLAETLLNAEIAAKTMRPICQDTGITVVFVELGQNVVIEGDTLNVAINKGVERGYKEGCLRKSIVKDAIFDRTNTGNNIPAIVHTEIVEGDKIKITVAPKGSGSENMSALKMFKPANGEEDIVDFVVDTVKNAGSNSCPPLHIGVGIGGTMEYACLLAKKALLNRAIPLSELEEHAKTDKRRALELKILSSVQKTGVGAQGMGGSCTAFAVSVETYPCHIAGLPVAVNLNCHAARHAAMVIDENTVLPEITPTAFENGAEIAANIDYSSYKKVALPLSDDDINGLKAGDRVLLSGEIYTARDAAHKKIVTALKAGEQLPFDLQNQLIYYAGPCPAAENEVIGPIGPTTAGRMDVYTPLLLDKGLKGMIGKGYRSAEVIEAIKHNRAVYFTATGGAACLLAQKVLSADMVAYPELGAEAVYKLKVKDFPAIVNVDSTGRSVLKPD